MIEHHLSRAAENSPAITYASAGATAVFWGLHVSDICMILSTLATLCGVGLQIFLALHRIRRLEQQQRATNLVVGAVTDSQRVVAAKVETLEKPGD